MKRLPRWEVPYRVRYDGTIVVRARSANAAENKVLRMSLRYLSRVAHEKRPLDVMLATEIR